MMSNTKVMFLFCYTILTNVSIQITSWPILNSTWRKSKSFLGKHHKRYPKTVFLKYHRFARYRSSCRSKNQFKMEGEQEVIRNVNTLDDRKMRLRTAILYFQRISFFVIIRFASRQGIAIRKGPKTKISVWNKLRWIPI